MHKPIQLSMHARVRAIQRGATEDQIIECIQHSPADCIGQKNFSVQKTFLFDAVSPVNRQYYRFKTVEVIFAEEVDRIVVITIKVYYSNEERQ